MTDVLLLVAFVAGVALLAVGAAMLLPPAGFLVAGAALVVVPVLYVRGRRLG